MVPCAAAWFHEKREIEITNRRLWNKSRQHLPPTKERVNSFLLAPKRNKNDCPLHLFPLDDAKFVS